MIHEVSGTLFLSRFEIKSTEIRDLSNARNREYGDPSPIEMLGRRMVEDQFQENAVKHFVEEVFKWGKGHRNLGRVTDNLGGLTIKLRQACDDVAAGHDANSVGRAIAGVRVPHLRLSFASKLIRFVFPDRAVIFDSVIRAGLGYAESSQGYSAFLSDCEAILARSGIVDPALQVCDVEAAVFMKLRGKS